jgi:hypothetical protein
MAACPKCGREVSGGGRVHYECPRPDMKPLSREEHDENAQEIIAMQAALNRELVANVPTEGFSVVWGEVLKGNCPIELLHESLMGIGRETGLGTISGVEYKTMRNQLDEMERKNDVRLRMTALSLGQKKNPSKKRLSVCDLRAREARV